MKAEEGNKSDRWMVDQSTADLSRADHMRADRSTISQSAPGSAAHQTADHQRTDHPSTNRSLTMSLSTTSSSSRKQTGPSKRLLSADSRSDPSMTRDELVEVSEIQKRKTILNFPVRPSHYSTKNYRLDFISLAFTGKPSISLDGNETTYTDVKVQQLIRRVASAEREAAPASGSRGSPSLWTHEATNTTGVDATILRDDEGELTMTLKHGKGSTGTLINGSYPVLAGQRCYVKDGSAFFADMFKEWRSLGIIRDDEK